MTYPKLAPNDVAPAEPRELSPMSPESMLHADLAGVQEPTTAVEAVRYLFLAGELRRLGRPHAADRWQAQAMAWAARQSPSRAGPLPQ